jgi:DNA repair exonuclease SbcCD ATPase subunit
VSDDDYESDDCRSNDDDEYTKEELLDMCEQVHTCFEIKRKECKELHKKIKSLEQSFDELNASHESLREDHEKLGKAHSKLEKAHSLSSSKLRRRKPRRSKLLCHVMWD